jgi:hypothetical protein
VFLISELQASTENPDFQSDWIWVRQSLALHRVRQDFEFRDDACSRLSHFVECVLNSAPDWHVDDRQALCRITAEIAELLSICSPLSDERRRRHRVRSALLYELADSPTLASAVLQQQDVGGLLGNFFARRGFFGKLLNYEEWPNVQASIQVPQALPLDLALSSDAMALASYEQGTEEERPRNPVAHQLAGVAGQISLGFTATELEALTAVLRRRGELATRTNLDDTLFYLAKFMQFPAELWTTQAQALDAGFLDRFYDSWGFAAPTGTGKTFLTRLLIISTLQDQPSPKVLYLVPSRALVQEVTDSLTSALQPIGYTVLALSAQLVDLEDDEHNVLRDAAVVVLTPEKADMLLRLGHDFIRDTSLLIVDEAHHLESGTRGVLLEMYLWRLKRVLQGRARIVFLSAVAPNILELAEWMGERPGGKVVSQRATRMRAGVYRLRGRGKSTQGWIEYSDGTSVCLVEAGVEPAKGRSLVQLADRLSCSGPVLVVAKGKKECEKLGVGMQTWLRQHGRLKTLSSTDLASDVVQRLDSRLEREMYATVGLRDLIRNRIAYHHAGLPPRVRVAVENAIRAGLVDFVFATTTLAEGVNFPFSSVIVQSLALQDPPSPGRPSRYHPVTPRSFWNIAGRAGRPSYDSEGQAILFEPSLGLERVNAVIDPYLDPSYGALDPVRSSLSRSLREMADGVTQGEFSRDELQATVLPASLPRHVHGTINLLRVGLVHARASNLLSAPEDLLEGTFAEWDMSDGERAFASGLIADQDVVVTEFLDQTEGLSSEIVAELGLSIETLSELRDWVKGLEDRQIQGFSNLMFGGRLNTDSALYVVSPVAKRMAELEGPKLGALYAEVIIHWLSGIPLTQVRTRSQNGNRWERLEDLIAIIYSRIQYLLPWGLYAADRLVEAEATQREIAYSNGIRMLAHLADAGVPSLGALRLVGHNFERVDATRLATLYYRRGGAQTGTDVVGWVLNQDQGTIERCVSGADNRRLDHDLLPLIQMLRQQRAEAES